MKVKVGAIITDASGSLGGHVLGTNRGTMVLKNKSVSKKPPTPAQSVYRSRTNFLMSKWSSLTDDQRRLWYLQIKDYKQTDIFNNIKTLNGFTLFQKLNQGLMICNLPALNTPAETDKPTPSNNLIISCSTTVLTVQSDFYNSTDEVAIYASGTLNSGITKPKKFLRLITILNGATIQTATDITTAYETVFGSITDTSRFFIANQTFSNLTGFSNGVLTISDFIVPETVVINLIPNGDFSNGTTDWYVPRNNASLSIVSGWCRITVIISGSNGIRTGNLVLEIGKDYLLTFDYDATGAGPTYGYNVRTSVNTNLGGVPYNNLGSVVGGTTGSFSQSFTAVSVNQYLGLIKFGGMTVGQYIEVDNFVLQEI